MRTKVAKALVVCALVSVIGGQWAILQSIAWVGMAFNYAQDSTLKEALVKTFDGRHPCKICKVVQAGKKSERKEPLRKLENKLDFWIVGSASLLCPPSIPLVLAGEPVSAEVRPESPPTPPPRSA